jgi:hypothetical protein
MLETTLARNESLRQNLLELVRREAEGPKPADLDLQLDIVARADAPASRSTPVDVVISVGEINDEHGTGPLVKRVFKDRRGIFSIRSQDHWGVQDFGDWHVRICPKDFTRQERFRAILQVLGGWNVRSVTCVPFMANEILLSIAIKEIFNAKLCLWIMDDNNVTGNGIPDEVMAECLEKCSLRLFTHPELRSAYEQKYKLASHILPAVVPAHLVVEGLPHRDFDRSKKVGALLGSFWDQSWFDRLCSVLEPCDWQINWYGQNRSPWMTFTPEALDRAHIRPLGIIPEDVLAKELRKYPFVMVPVSTLDGRETNKGIASLSLPGRILFAAATSHTPILVVGSEETCGARFVKHFGIGLVAPYESSAVAAAIDRLCEGDAQRAMIRQSARIAGMLSDQGVVSWLSESIEKGTPADNRFEDAFSGYNADLGVLQRIVE